MKTKRTYKLSVEVVEAVKRMVEREGLARSQDALVERAIREFARRARDEQHARRWAEAAEDHAFVAEARDLEAGFAADDLTAWPPE